MAVVGRTALEISQPILDPVPGFSRYHIFAGLHGLHVDTDRAVDRNAEVRGTAGHVRRVSAGHERFGRNAAGVDAGSAEQLAFDHGDVHPSGGETPRERRPGLPGPDDDRVIARHVFLLMVARPAASGAW